MKRESTLKFICGRLLLVAAFILAYLMLALGNTAHATGEFKGLEIIGIAAQQKEQVVRSLFVAKNGLPLFATKTDQPNYM